MEKMPEFMAIIMPMLADAMIDWRNCMQQPMGSHLSPDYAHLTPEEIQIMGGVASLLSKIAFKIADESCECASCSLAKEVYKITGSAKSNDTTKKSPEEWKPLS